MGEIKAKTVFAVLYFPVSSHLRVTVSDLTDHRLLITLL